MIHSFICDNCKISFNKNGIFTYQEHLVDDVNLSNIYDEMKKNGFNKAIINLEKRFNDIKNIFSTEEGDFVFQCLNNNNSNCLILNSNVGNICENLSSYFQTIYSFEKNLNFLKIQKLRFLDKNIQNVILIHNEFTNFPFPDNFFDLIVLNGINVDSSNIKNYFMEIKRVLKDSGTFCFSINNPRKKINDELFNLSNNSKNFIFYENLLQDLEFKISKFFNYGNLRKSLFLINFNNRNILYWFFKNYDLFYKLNHNKLFFKFLIFLTFLKLPIVKFSPNLLFISKKHHEQNFIQKNILDITKSKNFIQQIRFKKINFIVFDNNFKPREIVSFDKNSNFLKFGTKINLADSVFRKTWINGKPVDFTQSIHIELVLNWIKNHQLKNKLELFTSNEILNEINHLKNQVLEIYELQSYHADPFFNKCENYFSSIKLHKNILHNDFGPNNILYDDKNSSINIIDWSNNEIIGNPLRDFSKLLYHILTPDNSISQFEKNLNDVNLKLKLMNTFNLIYNSKMNLSILLKYFIFHHLVDYPDSDISLFLEFLNILDSYEGDNYE